MTPADALRALAQRIAPHLPPPLRDEARVVMEDAADALDEWRDAVSWEQETAEWCMVVASLEGQEETA